MNLMDNMRYYCPRCQRWFPADVIQNGMHTIVVFAGPDSRHVVWPEAEALAMFSEGKTQEQKQ